MKGTSTKVFADKADQDRVVQLYQDGHSTSAIGALCNRSRSAVRNLLKMRRIRLRSCAEQWEIRLARGDRPFTAEKRAP